MDILNYHHLYYFWIVAREGSITKACASLNLAQPTISAQLSSLEEFLGVQLFTREGRRLVLTDAGKVAQEYAETIFLTGRELIQVLSRSSLEKPSELRVGIIDSVPKSVGYRLIEPALNTDPNLKLICKEGRAEELLAALAIHDLDIVISDAPAPTSVRIQAYNHLLGESEVSVFAEKSRAQKLSENFPQSLENTRIYIPLGSSMLRKDVDQWLERSKIKAITAGEVQDGALLKLFAVARGGVFFAPTVVEHEMRTQYGASIVGKIPEITEKYFAISVERKLKHPAVIAITEAARNSLFQSPKTAP